MLHPREAPKSTTFNHSDHLTLLWPYIPDSPPRKKRAHDRRLDPLVLCLQLPLTTISPIICSVRYPRRTAATPADPARRRRCRRATVCLVPGLSSSVQLRHRPFFARGCCYRCSLTRLDERGLFSLSLSFNSLVPRHRSVDLRYWTDCLRDARRQAQGTTRKPAGLGKDGPNGETARQQKRDFCISISISPSLPPPNPHRLLHRCVRQHQVDSFS